MPRSAGDKNADHAQSRDALLKKIRGRLLRSGADRLSFREMAIEAGVSVPTLRHYFGGRTSLIHEVFKDLHREGNSHIRNAEKSIPNLRDSMQQAADSILAGIRFGRMDKIHTLGLTEGLANRELGPSYLQSILEPSLQAIECRLDEHRARGELADCSVRNAAVAFAAPLILASLHQFGLGGDCVRPLDLTDFARDHVEAFARAYGVSHKSTRKTEAL